MYHEKVMDHFNNLRNDIAEKAEDEEYRYGKIE